MKKFFSFMIAILMAITLTIPAPVLAAENGSDTSIKWHIEVSEPQSLVVWLHVVNGNFKNAGDCGCIVEEYEGQKYDKEHISELPSVPVRLDVGRKLPADIEKISVTRTGGTFKGWYTEAPTEELQQKDDYSVRHTVKVNGEKITTGSAVPDDVNVLYAVFDDSEETAETDKLVEFYLDWNGIDGMWGKCLTCTRSYKKDGAKTQFTADDAAVFGMNFTKEDGDEFDKLESSKDKWEYLKKIWQDETKKYNGYTFKGWSTQATGGELIWEDTPIKNGMSFYAQWEKGDESSDTFQRVDPDAGPLEFIRITGEGLNSALSVSKHALKDAAVTLTMLRGPIRAKAEDVTWTLTFSKSIMKTETVTVQAGDTITLADGGLEAKAEGYNLTITNMDDGEHGVTVGVSAKAEGEDGARITAPANANVGFVHTWDQGMTKSSADCEYGATVIYRCTGCSTTKLVKGSPLGHVYQRNMESTRYYAVIKEPTCTEEGEIQYKCLRCGEQNGVKKKTPALGHDWTNEVETPVSCDKDSVTRTCQREGCGVTEANLVPANNPELHAWTETDRYHNSCMLDTVYEKCAVCNETRHYTEAADNPDCHAYEFESRKRIDCEHVEYTFHCVHGCGSKEVKLVKEENHIWGDWKTSKAPTTKEAGEQERECKDCGERETQVLPQIAADNKFPTPPVNIPDPDSASADSEAETDTGSGTEANPETPIEPEVVEQSNAEAESEESATPEVVEQPIPEAELETNAAPEVAEQPETEAVSESIAEWSEAVSKPGSAAMHTEHKWGDWKITKVPSTKAVGRETRICTVCSQKQTKTLPRLFAKKGLKKVGDSGDKVYVKANGKLATGFTTVKGRKYYFDKKGIMQTGWKKIGGKKYYFNSKGVMQTGWKKIGGKKYYFNAKGVMLTGKQKIKGKTYTFKSSGVLKK